MRDSIYGLTFIRKYLQPITLSTEADQKERRCRSVENYFVISHKLYSKRDSIYSVHE